MTDYRTVTTADLFKIALDRDLSPKPGQKIRVLVNMVETVDGVTTIPSREGTQSEKGIAKGIGRQYDQKMMRILRIHADATLNGTNTLEASGSSSAIDAKKYPEIVEKRKSLGKQTNPLAVVVTSKADLSDKAFKSVFFKDPRFDSILFVAENAPEENLEKAKKTAAPGKKLDIVRLPLDENGKPDVLALIDVLRENYDVKTLLVEGGSTVNGSFIKEGLITDFFLTVSPRFAIRSRDTHGIVDGPKTLYADELKEAELVSSFLEEESGLEFKHYILNN